MRSHPCNSKGHGKGQVKGKRNATATPDDKGACKGAAKRGKGDVSKGGDHGKGKDTGTGPDLDNDHASANSDRNSGSFFSSVTWTADWAAINGERPLTQAEREFNELMVAWNLAQRLKEVESDDD